MSKRAKPRVRQNPASGPGTAPSEVDVRPQISLVDRICGLAEDQVAAGDLENTVGLLRYALRVDETHAAARQLLGEVLLDQGLLDEAVGELERVCDRDPQGGATLRRALWQLGQRREESGLEDTALEAYERLLGLRPVADPEDADKEEAVAEQARVRVQQIWLRRGERALAGGDEAAAVAAFERAGSQERAAEVATRRLQRLMDRAVTEAQEHARLEQWEDAARAWAWLAAQDPGTARWQEELARVQSEIALVQRYQVGAEAVHAGDLPTALRELSQIVALRPVFKDAASLLLTAVTRIRGGAEAGTAAPPDSATAAPPGLAAGGAGAEAAAPEAAVSPDSAALTVGTIAAAKPTTAEGAAGADAAAKQARSDEDAWLSGAPDAQAEGTGAASYHGPSWSGLIGAGAGCLVLGVLLGMAGAKAGRSAERAPGTPSQPVATAPAMPPPEVMAATQLAAVDGEILHRRWDRAIDQAGQLQQRADVPAELRDLAAARKADAERERGAERAYLRFLYEVGQNSDGEKLSAAYQQIPAGSVYREPTAPLYKDALDKLLRDALDRSDAARVGGRCWEFRYWLREAALLRPEHPQIATLSERRCVEVPARRGGARAATPVGTTAPAAPAVPPAPASPAEPAPTPELRNPGL